MKKLLAGLVVVAAAGAFAPAEKASAEAGWLDYHDIVILQWCSGTCTSENPEADCCQTPT